MSLRFEGCLLAVSIIFKAKSSRFPCLVDKSGQTSSLQRSSTCQWRIVDGRASHTDGDFFSFRWQGLPIKDNQILLPQASMLHDHCPALGMLPDATSTVHRTKVTVLMDHDKLIERESHSIVTNHYKHTQTQWNFPSFQLRYCLTFSLSRALRTIQPHDSGSTQKSTAF